MDNLGSQKLPFRRIQAATSEHVCRSPFCPERFQNHQFSLELAPLLAVSVSHELQRQTSALQRNKAFLGQRGLASGELPSVHTLKTD